MSFSQIFGKSPTNTQTPNTSAQKRQRPSDSPEFQKFEKLSPIDKLNAIMSEIMDTRQDVNSVRHDINLINEKVSKLEEKCNQLRQNLEWVQQEINKKKVRVIGIEELGNEKYSDLESKVHGFFRDSLNVPDIEIDSVRRVGKKDMRNRPVVITLLRTSDRFRILQAKNIAFKQLSEKKIYVKEELTEAQAKLASNLRKKATELKSATPGLKTKVIRGVLHTEDTGGAFKKYRLVNQALVEL